jgi:RES domain-containing protein
LIAYRITRAKFASDLSGAGGLHAAGRCNAKGTPVIYAAEHVSLALAEVLAHVDPYDIPKDYVVVTLEIPDTVPWQRCSAAEALRMSAKPPVPVFVVPSVIVPQENNVVLYPHAPGFQAVVRGVQPFSLDQRLVNLVGPGSRAAVSRGKLKGALASVLEGLPRQERQFLGLYYIEERSIADIALVMEISEADARMMHSTLLRWLQERLPDEGLW